MSARLCLVKQTVEPKLEPTMIRISNYKYILQQAPKNKASTYTKLLQSRPARPSGRSTSKENSTRSPYNSFTFFSGKYVPKHGFGDMLKKSVTQILDSHIIQFSNRSLKQLTSLPIKKAPFHRSSRSLAIAHWLSGHPKRKGLSPNRQFSEARSGFQTNKPTS